MSKIKYNKSSMKLNMILSGIVKPISMIINFIYIPIALNYLGIEKYGVWSTILSVLSWISYFDIGIGNGLRNKLAESLASEDKESSSILVSTSYIFIISIMGAIFILLAIICRFVNWNTVLGVKNISENLMLIVTVCIAFVCTNFVLTLCNNIIYALQRASIVSWIQLIIQILNLILVIVFSNIYKENLWVMAFVYGISMVSVNLFASIYIFHKHPYLKISIHKFDLKLGKQITSLGIQFFIIQICALVLFTTDNLIIAKLFTASDVTPFSTVNKLFSAVSSLYAAFIVPVWSSFTIAKSKGNYGWMKRILIKLNILMVPFIIGSILLGFIFKDISYIWLQRNLNYTSGLIWLGAIYCILTIWGNTYSMIANGLSLMKVSIVSAVVQAVVNIPLSLYFAIVCNMKSSGVLLGTVISMLIGSIIVPFYVVKLIYGKDK